MKLIMTPKQAREKVLTYKRLLKKSANVMNKETDIVRKLKLADQVVENQVKLSWAVSDYKLALKENGTI